MAAIITSALILFVLHGISQSSSSSLFDTGFNSLKENISLLKPKSDIRAKYFKQKLDHFDKNNENTWQQKYYQEDKYYATGGPVYLILEHGRFPSTKTISSGYWDSHGKDKKAMLFNLSHRYYDFLMPIDSAENEKLVHLTTSQALEDIVAFIKAMNKKHEFPKGTKWIVFGSSFAGNLAAWLRAKHPDLVYGAVASSAPVLARMDCPEYLNNVGDALAKHSEKCKKEIAQANTDLDKLVQSENGRKEIKKTFKLCEPLDGNKNNVSFFATKVTKYVSDEIQNDFKQEKVNQICKTMLKDENKKKPIQRYSAVLNMLMKQKKHKCLQTNFYTYSEMLKSTNRFAALFEGKFWLYQQCHEFGWFQTSDKKSNTFSKNVNLDYSINLCTQTFGSSINEKHIEGAVAKTNKLYYGLKINTARTLFINGDADPWKFAQVTSNKENKNVDVITIQGGSHCSDTRQEYSQKQEVEKAVKEIKNKLDVWLK